MLGSIGEVETLADDAREVQDLGDEHPVIPELEISSVVAQHALLGLHGHRHS
jgi:hypothetical protein